MVARPSSWLLASAALAGLLGCAHSPNEWKAKLRELDRLEAQLQNEQSQHGRSKKALEDESGRLERLTRELRAAGIDPEQVAAGAEQQARALEEHRLRRERHTAVLERASLLREKLAPLAKDGVLVVVRDDRLVIQLPGDALFEAGREVLKRGGRDLLASVAEVLRRDRALSARSWQVAGHMDDADKPGGAFKDGWGLSLMRAREVRAFLVRPAPKGGGGLGASRWSAAGYGDVDPVQQGGSPEAKKANRRCEIVALPAAGDTRDMKDSGR